MLASQILLLVGVASTIDSIYAKIPYDEIGSINIFGNTTKDFEYRTIASTRLVNDFFDRDDMLLAVSAGMIALKFAPYVKEFAKIVPLIRDTLADKSEWRSVFVKAILDESMHSIIESEINWMEATIQTIQTKIKLLGAENTDTENQKTIASIIHTDLVRMINLFELNSSLFRKHPLLAAPLLIQLASLVAIFNPLVKAISPLEAQNPDISCKMHDVLLDYRPRVVNDRLRELYTKLSSFKSKVNVMALPYNPRGYNDTDPGKLNCKKGCKSGGWLSFGLCFEDKFSKNFFDITEDDTSSNGTSVCVEDYGRLVRHRVEELFPVALLGQLCTDPKPKIPTGFGWLTINIQQVYTFGIMNGRPCKSDYITGCDPSIKLFVNDELKLQTPKLLNQFSFDPKITFTTAKIRKDSKIRIEVWHMKRGLLDSDGLIQSEEGDVESYLNEPLRIGEHVYLFDNRIESMSFWRDEYQ